MIQPPPQSTPARAATHFALASLGLVGLIFALATPMRSVVWPHLPQGAPTWQRVTALLDVMLEAFLNNPAHVLFAWLVTSALAAGVFLWRQRATGHTMPSLAAGLVAGFNPAILSLLWAPGKIIAEGAQPLLLSLLALALTPDTYGSADWSALPGPGLYLGTVSLGMAILGLAGARRSESIGLWVFGLGLALGIGFLACEPAMPLAAFALLARLGLAFAQIGAGLLNALVLTRLFDSPAIRPTARVAILAAYTWFLLVDFGQALP